MYQNQNSPTTLLVGDQIIFFVQKKTRQFSLSVNHPGGPDLYMSDGGFFPQFKYVARSFEQTTQDMATILASMVGCNVKKVRTTDSPILQIQYVVVAPSQS